MRRPLHVDPLSVTDQHSTYHETICIFNLSHTTRFEFFVYLSPCHTVHSDVPITYGRAPQHSDSV